MIRCITKEHVVLFASECEDESTRKLSRIGSLLCPNCLKRVRFNKGPKKGAYFSHLPDAECVVTNYEKETKQHLQGKEILFKWLTSRFKDAIVELEVYIPETHQIADILVTHTNEKAKGKRWAFEFQHSSLSSKDWEQRHNLYRAANIHDFWILDADKFLLFSNSEDPYIQKARRRKDPVETIFNTTGFCYFLKLDTSEITIDFSFRYEDIRGKDKYGRKFPPQEYKFHSPHDHSNKLSGIQFLYSNEFNFATLTFKNVADGVSTKFKAKLRQLEKEKEQKWNDELQVRANRKKEFAVKNYGEDFSSYMWSFMKANKEEIKDDVFNLSEEVFFSIYNKYAKKLQSFGEEIIRMEGSTILNHRIILKLYDKDEIQKLSFLEERKQTLEVYLTDKYSQQIKMINYVLSNYEALLEDLTSRNPKIISKKLSEVNYKINPFKTVPTKFDYAFVYHKFESKEQVDEILKKFQESLTFPGL